METYASENFPPKAGVYAVRAGPFMAKNILNRKPKFHSTRVEIDSILLLFRQSQNRFNHNSINFFRTNWMEEAQGTTAPHRLNSSTTLEAPEVAAAAEEEFIILWDVNTRWCTKTAISSQPFTTALRKFSSQLPQHLVSCLSATKLLWLQNNDL